MAIVISFWDTYVTYGRTESFDRSLQIIQERFEQAIQVTTDLGGNPVCVDQSNGCVALDVVGTATPEMVDYVAQEVVDKVTIEQRVFAGNIGGDLYDLPAGAIGVAGGFVYREESAKYDPNDLGENGFTRNTLVAIDGSFDTTEFYVETIVPILGGDMDIPFIDTFEFEGAIRFVDNSVAGKDTTWTAGLRFRPIDDIEFPRQHHGIDSSTVDHRTVHARIDPVRVCE